MSPRDFNLWGMGSSEKSRSVFFSVHLHHSRNGPGNVPCLKSVCLAAFGRNRNLHSISEAPVSPSLFNQPWIWSWNFWFEVIWPTLQSWDDSLSQPALQSFPGPSTCKPGRCWRVTKLGSFVQTLFLSEIFCSGVWAKICWYLQYKSCFVFLLFAAPRVSIFFFILQMLIF